MFKIFEKKKPGWREAGIDKDEISLITDVNENIALQYQHGYPVDPFLVQSFELTNELTAIHFVTQYSRTDDNDPRGSSMTGKLICVVSLCVACVCVVRNDVQLTYCRVFAKRHEDLITTTTKKKEIWHVH